MINLDIAIRIDEGQTGRNLNVRRKRNVRRVVIGRRRIPGVANHRTSHRIATRGTLVNAESRRKRTLRTDDGTHEHRQLLHFDISFNCVKMRI